MNSLSNPVRAIWQRTRSRRPGTLRCGNGIQYGNWKILLTEGVASQQRTNAMKTIRAFVSVSDDLGEVRAAVQDLLLQLNRHFKPRGVEFVPTLPTEGPSDGDLALALYWKDFGDLPKADFEKAYESFKATKAPKIYVFFKVPDEGITEALKAFRDSFAEKYGHFYCHFETLDAVKFQLAVQSLSWLPGAEAKEALKVEDGEVRLGEERVAALKDLPFAKLNAKRQLLLRQIDDAETEVEELEDQSSEDPGDTDLEETLRAARVKRHELKEELDQYDGFLCETAVFFAKESTQELDARVRKARDLFERGQARDANWLLDLPEMIERDRRDAQLFKQARQARVNNVQAFVAKAKLVMTDAGVTMRQRVDVASKAYDNAIRIGREIRLDEGELAGILFDYSFLLQSQRRFQAALPLVEEALAIYRRLAKRFPNEQEENVAWMLNNLAYLQRSLQRHMEAERAWGESLMIWRRLAADVADSYAENVAWALDNLATLHCTMNRSKDSVREHGEALAIWRRLAISSPETCQAGLATTLGNLALLHWKMDCPEEAELENKEALAIWRRLAKEEPDIYEMQVASTLVNQAHVLWFSDRLEKAKRLYREALGIIEKLARENPEAHESFWAAMLDNYASLQRALGRPKGAERRYKSALAIRRRLATRNPEVYSRSLAQTLGNLGNLHKNTNRPKAAEAEYLEALDVDRALSKMCPESYEPFVGLELHCLSELYESLGRNEEALTMAREAADVYGRCAERDSRQFAHDLKEAMKQVRHLEKHLEKKGCRPVRPFFRNTRNKRVTSQADGTAENNNK